MPREFVIVEGLLGFHSEVMRQFYDVKVYLDPPEDLRRAWKIKRDCTKRGYMPEQVWPNWRSGRPIRRTTSARSANMPTSSCASIRPRARQPEQAGPNLNVQLVLRPTIPHPDLSYLLNGNGHPDAGIRLTLARDAGRPVDLLEIDGGVTAEHAERLENAIWQHLPELRPVREDQFGDYQDRIETRHSHPLALTQLLLTYHLLHKHSDIQQAPFVPPVAALSRVRAAPPG